MSGFVYIWRDRKHRRFYIGSHWGQEDNGYVCSSTWMMNAYKKRPEDFKRKIISRVSTSQVDLLDKEEKWLNLIQYHELKKKYYNQVKTTRFHWKRYGSENVKQRISETLKCRYIGKNGPRYGKKHSEETKKNVFDNLS